MMMTPRSTSLRKAFTSRVLNRLSSTARIRTPPNVPITPPLPPASAVPPPTTAATAPRPTPPFAPARGPPPRAAPDRLGGRAPVGARRGVAGPEPGRDEEARDRRPEAAEHVRPYQ